MEDAQRRSWRAASAMLAALAIIAAMVLSTQGEADAGLLASHVIGVEVDVEINGLNANPGGTGDALMSVLVTKSRTQRPVTGIGSSVPRNNSGITLPTRVQLQGMTVAPGGCGVTPIQFTNSSNGHYLIRLVPFVNNPACQWIAGDYVYLVTIRASGGAVLGQGLAKLTIG